MLPLTEFAEVELIDDVGKVWVIFCHSAMVENYQGTSVGLEPWSLDPPHPPLITRPPPPQHLCILLILFVSRRTTTHRQYYSYGDWTILIPHFEFWKAQKFINRNSLPSCVAPRLSLLLVLLIAAIIFMFIFRWKIQITR